MNLIDRKANSDKGAILNFLMMILKKHFLLRQKWRECKKIH